MATRRECDQNQIVKAMAHLATAPRALWGSVASRGTDRRRLCSVEWQRRHALRRARRGPAHL